MYTATEVYVYTFTYPDVYGHRSVYTSHEGRRHTHSYMSLRTMRTVLLPLPPQHPPVLAPPLQSTTKTSTWLPLLSPKAYAHMLSMHTFCLLSAHFRLIIGLTFGPCSALPPSRSCTPRTICYAVFSSSLAQTLKIGACLDGLGCMRHKKARRCAVANSGARRRCPRRRGGARMTTLALIALLLALGTRP